MHKANIPCRFCASARDALQALQDFLDGKLRKKDVMVPSETPPLAQTQSGQEPNGPSGTQDPGKT